MSHAKQVPPSQKFDWQSWLDSLDVPDGEGDGRMGFILGLLPFCGETHRVHFSVVDGKSLAYSIDPMVGYLLVRHGSKVKGVPSMTAMGWASLGASRFFQTS